MAFDMALELKEYVRSELLGFVCAFYFAFHSPASNEALK